MDSPLKVDGQAIRKEAVKAAEREFAQARNTKEKHAARLQLQKARRAIGQ